jgi:putative glutamine amidotransferase
MDTKANGYWDQRYFIMNDYKLLANKYGVGMMAIMSEEAIPAAVAACDGLFVPGSGTGIDPTYYGGAPLDPPNVVDEYALDSKIMRAFYEAGKPIFGICGGLQALNVFLGGTLKKVEDIEHHYDHEKNTHEIDVTEGSFVYDVFGKTRVTVNSYHSWCIDDLAPGLTVAARALDGTIEAVEWKEKKIFATQWHPEQSFHVGDPLENRFIENFIRVCAENSRP